MDKLKAVLDFVLGAFNGLVDKVESMTGMSHSVSVMVSSALVVAVVSVIIHIL